MVYLTWSFIYLRRIISYSKYDIWYMISWFQIFEIKKSYMRIQIWYMISNSKIFDVKKSNMYFHIRYMKPHIRFFFSILSISRIIYHICTHNTHFYNKKYHILPKKKIKYHKSYFIFDFIISYFPKNKFHISNSYM